MPRWAWEYPHGRPPCRLTRLWRLSIPLLTGRSDPSDPRKTVNQRPIGYPGRLPFGYALPPMLARIQSYLLQGIDASPCEVEVDHDETASNGNDGGPRVIIVGLPDAGVRESHERVRSALANSGFVFPFGRILINLAPADTHKEGPVYDLPIALGLLVTQGILKDVPGAADNGAIDHRRFLVGGELALDGRVRPIKGVIALASLAKLKGARGVIVPAENAAEAAVVEGIEVIGVRTLSELVGVLKGDVEPTPVPAADVEQLLRAAAAPVDFVEVRGQEAVKRAIIVAAAGGHNIFKLWPTARDSKRRLRRPPWRPVGHNCLQLGPSVRHGGGGLVVCDRP